jgi:hypothetical protein
MLYATWLDFDSDDSASNFIVQEVRIIAHVTIFDFNVHMIEEVIRIRISIAIIQHTSVLRFPFCRDVTTHWKAGSAHIHILLINETKCHGHVVDDPEGTSNRIKV